MTTNSKSSLKYIVALAIIIFFAALLWNSYHIDNSEPITNIPEISPLKKITTKKTQLPHITQSVEEEPSFKTESDNPNKKVANEFYNFNVYLASLRTADSLSNAIINLRNKGEFEKADKVEDKLINFFPDHEIPN